MTPPKPEGAVDIDDAEADIRHSMASDDRQTRAEYQRGCEALAALLAELRSLRGGGWIACADRMPPTGMTVIVEGGTAQFDGIEWRSVSASLRPIQWRVTHWQHLPHLPAPPQAEPATTGEG